MPDPTPSPVEPTLDEADQGAAARAWTEVERYISGTLGRDVGESDQISIPLHVLSQFIRTNPADLARRDAVIERLTEALARASWTRCRSMADRKYGAVWESVDESVRDAWRKGAESDLKSAGILM